MNLGQIIGWILNNQSIIATIIQAIETVATDLQNLHGNSSLDAYAKAILGAIEGFFQSMGANTQPTPAEHSSIAPTVSAAVSASAQPPGSAP